MNTMTAPVQTDAAAWKQSRLGRFTASDLGKLFTEPRTLSQAHVIEYCHLLPDAKPNGRGYKTELRQAIADAGISLFGDTAMSLIASKAGERLTGVSENQATTRSMDRGTVLELAARYILSYHWKPIDNVTFLPLGENAGATPDGLTDNGHATVDIKCPESFGDVILFDQMVGDVCDFEALESWNKNYAWQIMMQAKCAGTRYGYLVYFTDRLPIHKLDDTERDLIQNMLNDYTWRLGEQTGRPWDYRYETNGFHYAAKRFELTDERSKKIDQVLASAEVECQRIMAMMQ